MKHLSKSDSILLLFSALCIVSLLLCTHMFANNQRPNNYDIGINILPNLFCSIEIAKATLEFENIDLDSNPPNPVINTTGDFPKWVEIFNNTSSVSTNLVNIIDGKIVFQNTSGESTFSTLLGGPLTSEDVLFFKVTNLSSGQILRCSLENTGANGYSFTTSPTTNIAGTEYVLTDLTNGNPEIFYVYPNAWYQNQKLNFNINIEATANTFTVATNLEKCLSNGVNSATNGINYVATLSPNPGYSLPNQIVVSIAGVSNNIISDALVNNGIIYVQSNGLVRIEGFTITGNIIITASASVILTNFNVSTQLTNCSLSTGQSTTTPGVDYSAILSPSHSTLPGTVFISIGGVSYEVKSDTLNNFGISYIQGTGTIRIQSDSITGNIVITATATLNSYPVNTTHLNNCSLNGPETATYGNTYTATLIANDGYDLPNEIAVSIAGGTSNTIISCDSAVNGITYVQSTGVITIQGTSIIGNIVITSVATEEDPTPAINTSWDGSIATSFAVGNGTVNSPYQISTAAELAFLAQQVNNGYNCFEEFFQLTDNIYLNNETFKFNATNGLITISDGTNYMCVGSGLNETIKGKYYTSNGEDYDPNVTHNSTTSITSVEYGTNGKIYYWNPIGNQTCSFKGTFFGGEFNEDDELIRMTKNINGLYINNDGDNIGLFGNATAAYFGLCCTNGLIIGQNSVGCLVGNGTNNQYETCSNGAIVVGSAGIGGIIGSELGSIAYYCINSGLVIGNTNIGGIVGVNTGGETVECVNNGEVNGITNVGGICGQAGSVFDSCLNSGDINGTDNIGGICGLAEDIEFQICENSGNVNGVNYVGEICGYFSYPEEGDFEIYFCDNNYNDTKDEVGGVAQIPII